MLGKGLCSHSTSVTRVCFWGLACVFSGMTWEEMILSILSWLSNRWLVNNKRLSALSWKSYTSCATARTHRALGSDTAGKEQGKEKGKEGTAVPSTGERVMVSCCWPTLSDNWFLVCGSAWQDARRQEPSSAGRIPAVARERRQPGRRVLLDWFYMGPSSSPVHLYPAVKLAMAVSLFSSRTYLFMGCR